MKKRSLILNEKDISKIIDSMVSSIVEDEKELKNLAFIGIIKRGDIIAKRVAERIFKLKNIEIPIGKIDINLYRDDLSLIDYQPLVRSTEVLFDINDKVVYLFDDVFFTGRTIRSALVEILDIGRPKMIKLFVLVDRKSRELPIRPDFSGIELEIPKRDNINVFLKEIDGKDVVEKEEN
ncbi:MAG: bifunctional pyr operon transcriptional regulator/uracil phosphoribosyltransferase PyrR [bacterium]|uniref:Bifunctional protein PyrR n=2 Tax=Bacteria candidate phyla TaxID=1783234 RepID=A0A101I345_UNCT6|nr:MAG: Bifunctional protein PyrR [candidate division TA06 bacterium 32_111]KUK87886.1 MAG: Bifunctional protein PyrR [candidate division TA06 bacterium 34_109]MDI6700585.1 bifunctional pyr operon transcriptional regulator/uracil phosphoribosyltransferase PyrR [bacterium]HAF08039.1 bifunctional pyr operon transcriptional regulator/uracil phosphoribosyltransferase PyrR [candidate division WOR-3 bacterium]HCP16260.1 bifunctional pyr operon transcriptional regulator/uracil phosphoribosyltransferas